MRYATISYASCDTKEFGRTIFFDFAGQKEFYTSHCAILENAVQTSPTTHHYPLC